MHVLVLTNYVFRHLWETFAIPGIQLEVRAGEFSRGEIFADAPIVDADVIVISGLDDQDLNSDATRVTALLEERFDSGARLVVFADSSDLEGFGLPRTMEEVPPGKRIEMPDAGAVEVALGELGDALSYHVRWSEEDSDSTVGRTPDGWVTCSFAGDLLILPGIVQEKRTGLISRLFDTMPWL